MFTIEVDVSDAVGDLNRLKGQLSNMAPALKKAGAYMERETKQNFARQSAPDGSAWAGLAASTLRQKRGGRILQETGALVGSISTQTSGTEARVGTSLNYGVFHQFGTSRMPARPFLGIVERHHEPIKQIVEAHLQSVIG